MSKEVIEHFLANNQQWADSIRHRDPEYFDALRAGQKPVALLLGCSDSRVSPAIVLGSDLGEIFVHRNIANVVAHADLNFLSVLQYALEVLGVEDVIIYGHYGCGGVRAALFDEADGLINNWLAHIKDVARRHEEELNGIADETQRLNRLVELNVLAQIDNLKQTSVFSKAQKAGRAPELHAWVYDFSTGLVRVLDQ